MGEYATYKGESVKIGTCEDLYYLRVDQAHLVTPQANSLDPMDKSIHEALRFRFPFPDEDHLEPGCFEDHNRGFRIPSSWVLPPEYDDHGSVQFTASAGYVMSIPCPEWFQQPGMSVNLLSGEDAAAAVGHLRAYHGSNTDDLAAKLERLGSVRVGRNGFNGGPRIVQQGFRDGQLRTIVQCGACGSKWNLSPEAAADVCTALLEEADAMEWIRNEQTHRHSDDTRRQYAELARRILAGYALEVETATA